MRNVQPAMTKAVRHIDRGAGITRLLALPAKEQFPDATAFLWQGSPPTTRPAPP
jgi:hypothetical protein